MSVLSAQNDSYIQLTPSNRRTLIDIDWKLWIPWYLIEQSRQACLLLAAGFCCANSFIYLSLDRLVKQKDHPYQGVFHYWLTLLLFWIYTVFFILRWMTWLNKYVNCALSNRCNSHCIVVEPLYSSVGNRFSKKVYRS